MNFDRISDDISDGRTVVLSQKEAGKYIFYLIRLYANEGRREEDEPEFYISAIDELLGYLRDIVGQGWSRAVFSNHQMATTEIIVEEKEDDYVL